MHVPPPLQAGENAATGIVVGPVSVEFAWFAQSTWNFHSWSAFVVKLSRYSGEPTGGGVEPSRSAGSMLPKDALSWKHFCVAACPASILARSKAQTCGPRKNNALRNMLNVV